MTADQGSQYWRLAEQDMAAAERLGGAEPLLEQALFHCQQAAEKALKSHIVTGGTTPPQTHDLLLLVSLGGLGHDAVLNADAALLRQYSVAPRYPVAGRSFDRAELAPALAAARRVLDRVQSVRGQV
ncbi:MAG: HEPN domain-containing protein [Longimicrobiales bacterium]